MLATSPTSLTDQQRQPRSKRKRDDGISTSDGREMSREIGGVDSTADAEHRRQTRLRIVTDLPNSVSLQHPTGDEQHGNTNSPTYSIFDEIGSPSSLFSQSEHSSEAATDEDSLFDEPRPKIEVPSERDTKNRNEDFDSGGVRMSMRTAPPIPGLYIASDTHLPLEVADEVMQKCMDTYFREENVNQVMLFGRTKSKPDDSSLSRVAEAECGLPTFLTSLLSTLSDLLRPTLPTKTHSLLFPPENTPPRARQAILNLYRAGDGISPHVDLLKRFGDGIVGISLGSGCVMRFEKQAKEEALRTRDETPAGSKGSWREAQRDPERWDLYLPERSILVLSEEARYNWTHGIEGRLDDFVQQEGGDHTDDGEWIARKVRLSITFRWLLPGAEIVGESD